LTGIKVLDHVQVEMKKCTKERRSVASAPERGEILARISEWGYKEEMMRWEQAKLDYLRQDDKNSPWFHNLANRRRRVNFISELKGRCGALCSKQSKLESIVV